MKTLNATVCTVVLTAGGMMAPASLGAAIIQVDHSNADSNPPSGWNVLDPVPTVATAVLDSNGNDDGVTVTYNANWTRSGATGQAGAFVGTSWEDAANDRFFANDGTTGAITIAGLLVGEPYTIRIIGVDVDDSVDRSADYRVMADSGFGDGESPLNGNDYNPYADGNQSGRVMTFSGVSPDSNGEIEISATGVGTQPLGILSAYTVAGKFNPASAAAVIKVDNSNAASDPPAGWNVLNPVPTVATAVLDSNGNDDGVTVTYNANWTRSGATGQAGAFVGTSWEDAANDRFFANAGTTGTITIAGLLVGETYTIEIIGADVNDSVDRTADYRVNASSGFGDGESPLNGDNYNPYVDGFQNGRVMTFSNIFPDSNGEIGITATGVGTQPLGILSAYTIEGNFAAESTPRLAVSYDGTALTFTWDSLDGKQYDLLSAAGLDTPRETWPVYQAYQNILASGTGANTLPGVAPDGATRFFALREEDQPPPPPLLDEDFEGAALPDDWARDPEPGAGTAWEFGEPSSSTGASTGPDGGFGGPGTNCAGTNLLGNYTADASASLKTPALAIPAGGATLAFQQWLDTESNDTNDFGTINVLDADNADALLAVLDTNIAGLAGAWDDPAPSYDLGAYAGQNIKLEFVFTSNATEHWAGWYIDDVTVTVD